MSEAFQLQKKYWVKYGSNWLKFENGVLLSAPALADGSTDHLKDDEEWSEVSESAFDERDFQKLYLLAVATQTKGETNE
jgi:hypothetical protein